MPASSEPPDDGDGGHSTNGVIFSVSVTKKDAEIDRLSNQLAEEKDARKEERFGWIVALVTVLNVVILGEMESLFAPIVIFVLELLALLVLARRSGIEYIELLISRAIGAVTRHIGRSE